MCAPPCPPVLSLGCCRCRAVVDVGRVRGRPPGPPAGGGFTDPPSWCVRVCAWAPGVLTCATGSFHTTPKACGSFSSQLLYCADCARLRALSNSGAESIHFLLPVLCPKVVSHPLLSGRLVTAVACSDQATVAFARACPARASDSCVCGRGWVLCMSMRLRGGCFCSTGYVAVHAAQGVLLPPPPRTWPLVRCTCPHTLLVCVACPDSCDAQSNSTL
jgi:hypothetical protein